MKAIYMLSPAVLCAFGLAAPAASQDLVAELTEVAARFEGVGGSGVVFVAAGDEVIVELGFGWADREGRRPMTPDAVVTMGSITKSFTALAILKLAAEGKLAIDDPLAKHLDGVPDGKRSITLRQLLSHTSGVVSALGDDWDLEATREWLQREALAAPLQSAPGTEFLYSNVGFSLLGMVVEEASGKPYEEYLHAALLEPLGMRRTGYLIPAFAADEIAVGYQDGERWGTVLERPLLADGPCWNLRANGGLHTTARDMHRLASALSGTELLPASLLEQAFTPQVPDGRGSYGLGFGIAQLTDGVTRVGHSGGNGVYSAYFALYPEAGLNLFVASTVSEISVMRLLGAVEGALFGLAATLPPETVALDAERLAELAGDYTTEGGDSFVLRVSDRGLVATFASPGGVPADPGLRELVERTEDAFRRSLEGEHATLRTLLGVEAPLAEFARRQDQEHRRLEEEHGSFVELGVVTASSAGSGADLVVRFEFDRGAVLLLAKWRGGTIGELLFVDRLPGRKFALYPLSDAEFSTFRFDQAAPALRLVLDEGGLLVERAGRRERARRN